MDDTQINKLLAETYTKAQLLRRLRVLKDFVDFRLFNLTPDQTKLPLQVQIDLFLALHQKDLIELNLLRQEGHWLMSLGQEFFSQFNLDNHTQNVRTLEQFADQISPIIVYLPVELPEKNQLELGSWFKQNLNLKQIFEIQFDGNLIGGCALSFNGTYKDYSLKSKIDQNKDKIISSLKEFKR